MATKAKNVIAPIRKRLLDLYTIGQEVEFEDDQGSFSIWVQRINNWQEKNAVNKSKIVRSPIIALKRDKLNPDRLAYDELLVNWGLDNKESQVDFLISPKVQQVRESITSKIAAEDKWANEDYLLSLQEAWNGGVSEVYAKDPDDKEASRIYAELKKYTEEVESAVDHEAEEFRLDMMEKDDAVIYDQIMDLIIDSEADSVQMAEFRRWQIFYACRTPEDHDELIFESREDVDYIDEKIYTKLLETYIDISFEGIEGKE